MRLTYKKAFGLAAKVTNDFRKHVYVDADQKRVWATDGHRAHIFEVDDIPDGIDGAYTTDETPDAEAVAPPVDLLVNLNRTRTVLAIKMSDVLDVLEPLCEVVKPRHTVTIRWSKRDPEFEIVRVPTQAEEKGGMRPHPFVLQTEGSHTFPDAGDVSLNARYLLEALVDLGFDERDEVPICRDNIGDALSPVVIFGPRGRAMIMPVRR